jgi:hypothetical protein
LQQRSRHHRAVTGGLPLPSLLLPLVNCSFQLLIRQKQSLSMEVILTALMTAQRERRQS